MGKTKKRKITKRKIIKRFKKFKKELSKNRYLIAFFAIALLMIVLMVIPHCSNKQEQAVSHIPPESASTIGPQEPTTPAMTTVVTTVPTTAATTTTTTTVTTPKPTTPKSTTPKATTVQTTPVPTTTTPVAPPKIDTKQVGTVKVTASAVNIRSAASSEAGVIGTASNGNKLEIIGYSHDKDGNMWYAVKYKKQTGFVIASSVEPAKNIGTAYLTFDDGPSKNTVKIFDILDKYGVKATFFVKYNKGCDSIYKQIVDRGNTIADHTYSHNYANIYSSDEAFFADIEKMNNFIREKTGEGTKIIRFPGGSSNTVSKKYNKGIISRLTKSLGEKGYVYFDWNVDSGDANGTTVAKNTIVNNVKNNVGVKSQVVILMHDSSSKTTTVEALPEIIEYLQSRGYSISRITQDTPAIHHSVKN